ncbi:MAG: sulfatase [Chitinophagales bacterium]
MRHFFSVKLSGVFRLPLWLTLLSAVLIALWAFEYGVPKTVVMYHAAVAFVFHFSLWFTALILRRFMGNRLASVLVLTIGLSSLGLFYFLIFLSMNYWGDVITVTIARSYVKALPQFLDSLPMERWLAVLLLLLPFLFVVTLLLLFRKKIAAQLDLGAKQLHWSSLALLALMAILLSAGAVPTKRYLHLRGEPMLVFLFDKMWGWNNNPFFDVTRNEAGKRDAIAFQQYLRKPLNGNRKHVILIVCDGLRADHLGVYGYGRNTSPFLNHLVENQQAIAVRDVYASGAATVIGVPSLLLSQYATACSPYGFNLVKLLHAAGYNTHVLVSGAHREWYNIASFYLNDCDSYFDGKDSKLFYFKDDRVLKEGLRQTVIKKDVPQFFYFHLQSPHETALLRDTFAVFRPYKKGVGIAGETAAVNAYDNKIIQADATIAELLQELDLLGVLKNAIVVVTSDHGEGLGEHGIWGHVDWLYQPQVKIPLIIADRELQYYKNREFARQIDIAPTLVHRLGLPIPETWQGRSLGDTIAGEITARMETGSSGLSTGRERKAEVVFSSKRYVKHIYGGGEKEEWYDLRTNPREERGKMKDER